jgi:hypothetical protein
METSPHTTVATQLANSSIPTVAFSASFFYSIIDIETLYIIGTVYEKYFYIIGAL